MVVDCQQSHVLFDDATGMVVRTYVFFLFYQDQERPRDQALHEHVISAHGGEQ